MNKFIFETTDATKARRILDILADGEGRSVATAASAPVPPRPQAVASTTPPAAPAAPPAAPAAPPAAPAAPPAAPAAPPAAPAAPPAAPAAPPAAPAAPPAAPAAPPAAPAAPPAAPAAPPAAPAAPPVAISKAELIKRMGSYVSQGLPVAQIRQINTQLCGQPNAQAIPDELLGQALAQYDAAFAAHKGA